MPALEDVESLLLQQDLLILGKVVGQLCFRIVRNASDLVRNGFWNEISTRRALHAMGRKYLELGVVGRVKVSMRDKDHLPLPRGIGQASNVREQLLCPRHI